MAKVTLNNITKKEKVEALDNFRLEPSIDLDSKKVSAVLMRMIKVINEQEDEIDALKKQMKTLQTEEDAENNLSFNTPKRGRPKSSTKGGGLT